VCRRWN